MAIELPAVGREVSGLDQANQAYFPYSNAARATSSAPTLCSVEINPAELAKIQQAKPNINASGMLRQAAENRAAAANTVGALTRQATGAVQANVSRALPATAPYIPSMAPSAAPPPSAVTPLTSEATHAEIELARIYRQNNPLGTPSQTSKTIMMEAPQGLQASSNTLRSAQGAESRMAAAAGWVIQNPKKAILIGAVALPALLRAADHVTHRKEGALDQSVNRLTADHVLTSETTDTFGQSVSKTVWSAARYVMPYTVEKHLAEKNPEIRNEKVRVSNDFERSGSHVSKRGVVSHMLDALPSLS